MVGKSTRSIEERFWALVDVRSPDECWPTLSVKSNGYAQFRVGGRSGTMVPAHRVAYELTYGPIPEGLEIDHVKARGCTMTNCCNPRHLEAVTHAENRRRARRNCCKRGHLRSEHGKARKDKPEYWDCRECQRVRRAARA